MVRRSLFSWALGVAVLVAARPVSAGPVTYTGNAEVDFDPADTNVRVISDAVGDVVQDQWISDRGWQNGWDMKDIRFRYDAQTDILHVGVNFVGIAGDADGNGDPNGADPMTIARGGSDKSLLAGSKTISVAFAADAPGGGPPQAGTPVMIAGVPSGKNESLNGIEQFRVASYVESMSGLGFSFGTTLNDQMGGYLNVPSKDQPDYLFNIGNFSKILDPDKGIWIKAFAGATDDRVASEDMVFGRLPRLSPQQIPEPTTILAWSALALGAYGYARRRRASRV